MNWLCPQTRQEANVPAMTALCAVARATIPVRPVGGVTRMADGQPTVGPTASEARASYRRPPHLLIGLRGLPQGQRTL